MKIITYRCNLCGKDAGEREIVGVHFVSFPADGLLLKLPHECEHHVCRACLRGLRDNRAPGERA